MTEESRRFLTIKERKYALFPMPPLKAIVFAPKVAKLIAIVVGDASQAVLKHMASNDAAGLGSEALKLLGAIEPADFTQLAKEAIAYEVYAGTGKLGDDNHFNEWFRQYPQDMFPVCCWAIWEHSKQYFLDSPAAFQNIFMGDTTSEPLPFRQAGKPNT